MIFRITIGYVGPNDPITALVEQEWDNGTVTTLAQLEPPRSTATSEWERLRTITDATRLHVHAAISTLNRTRIRST